MWHWGMLKVWRVRLILPIYIYLQTRKKLDMWECCRRWNKQGVFLLWLRAHLVELEIPLLFGETSFAYIYVLEWCWLRLLWQQTHANRKVKPNVWKQKVCQSDRVSRNTGLAARWPKRNSNFPFLLYVSLEFHWMQQSVDPVSVDDRADCSPIHSSNGTMCECVAQWTAYGIICLRAQKSYKVIWDITLYIVLVYSALLNQVEAIPVSSLLLEPAALAIIHDCFFGGVVDAIY